MAGYHSISKLEARRSVVAAGALGQTKPFGTGKAAVMRAIDHLGYVQIDTISVILRAHHHVLASRIPGYQEQDLLKLQSQDRKVLEYWSHAAAYLSMDDFRYTWPMKQYFRDKRDPWPKVESKLMTKVLERVRTEGPLMARDFESKTSQQKNGWWDWKPAKRALERLFLEGELLISTRVGFQKVYDVPDRVIPNSIDTSFPTNSEYARYLIKRAVKVHGLVTAGEVAYLRKGIKETVTQELGNLVEEGRLSEVRIGKYGATSYFTSSDVTSNRITKRIQFLSPFDHLTIQRKRLIDIFDYEYLIECYVPKQKRKYGYFCLPILYGDQFIGRMDAKAHRKENRLEVISLHFESKKAMEQVPSSAWSPALQHFALMNGCLEVDLNKRVRF